MSISGPVNNNPVPLPLSLKTTESGSSAGKAAASSAPSGGASSSSAVKAGIAPSDPFVSLRASLNRAASLTDLSLGVGNALGGMLNDMHGLSQQALDPALSPKDRAGLQNNYSALLNAMSSGVDAASFDNLNLINGSHKDGVNFIANPQGDKFITIQPYDLRPGQDMITVGPDSNLSTADAARSAHDKVSASLQNLGTALLSLQTSARQIDAHSTFLNRLSTTSGAQGASASTQDLSKESAKLQALQIQQQLSSGSFSIANQTPNSVLGLFRA